MASNYLPKSLVILWVQLAEQLQSNPVAAVPPNLPAAGVLGSQSRRRSACGARSLSLAVARSKPAVG